MPCEGCGGEVSSSTFTVTVIHTTAPDNDFLDTDGDGTADLSAKHSQILKVIGRDGSVQFLGGSKTVTNAVR